MTRRKGKKEQNIQLEKSLNVEYLMYSEHCDFVIALYGNKMC